jgi:hypothetical protein
VPIISWTLYVVCTYLWCAISLLCLINILNRYLWYMFSIKIVVYSSKDSLNRTANTWSCFVPVFP